MEEKIDFRTPYEKARDDRRESAANRFLELMTYYPSVTRAIAQVSKEYSVTKQSVRNWLLREGVYEKGPRGGVNNGARVIPRQ